MAKGTKRAAPQPKQGPSKKRKLAPSSKKDGAPRPAAKAKPKGKGKAKDQPTIPIPASAGDDEDGELSEQDLELAQDLAGAAFLGSLDKTAISRSKKETVRLHQMTKLARESRRKDEDDLPSIASHSDDGETWDSGLDDEALSGTDDDADDNLLSEDDASLDSDAEMPYESMPRTRRPDWNEAKDAGVSRLPIKLADGRIQKSKEKVVVAPSSPPESDEEESEAEKYHEPPPARDDVATGARFGRPAVADVVSKGSRKARVQAASEQIASICQEILADPENSLGLLRRLHTFSLKEIPSAAYPEPVPNDDIIRRLALLSQMAIFKDIIPGYRIRPLSDQEKAEKVTQFVQRTREWEQGLVGVYQSYLRGLEQEVKAKTALADDALRCMCTLLKEVTHFNFRTNLLASIIARLSKKSWDESSALCLDTLVVLFRADADGQASLEAVRLLNRMIKERRFAVHPAVLSCLLHLRLHSELGVRASETHADKEQKKAHTSGKAAARRAKGKAADAPHLSKKAKTALKEKKEIEREMREAGAEVDKEERATNHTETLKLLFVLYFRILKETESTPLLSAALRGISRYAHHVNVDFFKDLITVLKGHINRAAAQTEDGPSSLVGDVRLRLDCTVTAFELLTGQGEALNLDLSDFIGSLYALLLPLSLVPDLEATPPEPVAVAAGGRAARAPSTADLLFRALDLAFSPRSLGTAAPTWQAAALAKRLLGCALCWPPASAARALLFVRGLLAKDARLEALLATDDRAADGVFRPELDDPQLANALSTAFWELHLLRDTHWDERVRAEARRLSDYTRL